MARALEMVLRGAVRRLLDKKNHDCRGIPHLSGRDGNRKNHAFKYYGSLPRLTPHEVSRILRHNEFTKEFDAPCSIKYYESNQLASNNPIEDTRAEAKCLFTDGFLLGVFDGHGGGACAQVVAERLFSYISARLLPPERLASYANASRGLDEDFRLLERYNDKLEFVSNVGNLLHDESFLAYLHDLVADKNSGRDVSTSLVDAFLRLDNDLSNEALRKLRTKDAARILSVAMSGAVAVVAHIDGSDLRVANVGDCQAILGSFSENEGWSAKLLTVEHNAENRTEVERILSEHPAAERTTAIKMERLLGQLAPLRSLGDFRYKWSKDLLKEVVVPYLGEAVIPPNYYTPPYLSATPDVMHHRLAPNNKFLILASDGLWDLLTPNEAVCLVAEHMNGKMAQCPVKFPCADMKLAEINELLLQRRECLRKQPLDDNAATHLLRHALGGAEHGVVEHDKLSQLLTLPSDVVRVFRDDITITIAYLNFDYLEKLDK